MYEESTRYVDYAKEIELWKVVTALEPEKQALVLVLALGDLKKDVLENISLEDLNKETGVDTYLAYLEGRFGQDELVDSLETYKNFRDYQRCYGQSIGEYCAAFELKLNRIKNNGIVIPPEVLAFEVIRNAKISPDEEKLVMTGIDYKKRADMYKDAVVALKKFCGGGCSAVKPDIEPSIKCEPTYATWNKGYRGGFDRNQRNQRGRNFGRQSFFRGRGMSRGQGGIPLGKDGMNRRQGKNPIGRDGRMLLCYGCGSFNHLLDNCPEKTNNVSYTGAEEVQIESGKVDNVNGSYVCDIILYTGYDEGRLGSLCHDTVGCAILDSACASTVAGQEWVNDFTENRMSEEDKKMIKTRTGVKMFRFGDGPVMKSKYEIDLPVEIANEKLILTIDVVDANIPLLLSKQHMKSYGMTIDLANDKAMFMGKRIWLDEAESGHYMIPLTSNMVKNVMVVELKSLGGKELKKALYKLHAQFGHPVRKKLSDLIKNAGVWSDDFNRILDPMYENCQICKQFHKTPARPVVAMTLATEFNEAVCMDLKTWKSGLWILHMIDVHSRYTRSVFVDRKLSTSINDAVLTNWVAIFGVMKKLLTDNGGEFTAEETREITSNLNVIKLTTAAESPWQNGLCERVHQVTDMILLKLCADYPDTKLEVLLAWANMARNSLYMYNGFSSHQIVFGVNPNLPCVMNAKVPGLNETTGSEVFAKHLNALHASREAYIKSEAAEKIKRALRHKIRASQQIFNVGEAVYYKRDNKERWLGPAKVMFQDDKIVFVRHGNVYVRVSVNRLIKAGDEDWMEEIGETEENKEEFADAQENIDDEEVEVKDEAEVESKDEGQETEGDTGQNVENKGEIVEKEKAEKKDEQKITNRLRSAAKFCPVCTAEVREEHPAIQCDTCNKWCHIECINVSKEEYTKLTEDVQRFEWNCPKHKDNVQENKKDHRNKHKKKEKNDDATNVYVTYVPKSQYDTPESIAAMEEELSKLQEYDVNEVVDYDGQDCVSTRWILTVKNGKVKARLVARGYEEQALVRRDSPTVAKVGIRILLTIAAVNQWQVKSTDIRSAFLQGQQLDREVYIKPPKEAKVQKGKVWRLKKCLYGLNDASRKFYLSIKEVLVLNGCKQSAGDTAFFYFKENEKLAGVIISHIDDFLHAGNENFGEKVVKPLTKKFSAGREEEKEFSYVGLQISQGKMGIKLDQNQYIASIETGNWSEDALRDKHRELEGTELTEYRALVGSLNWCVQGSRPDQAFEQIELSMKLKNAKVEDYTRAVKVLKRLKSTNVELLFSNIGPFEEMELAVFCDASFANVGGVSSAIGYIIFCINPKTNKTSPIAWKANKAKRIVKSTLAAEGLSLAAALEDAYFVRNFLCETLNLTPKIRAYVDNKGLVENLYSTKLVEDSRLNIDLSLIKEMLARGEVEEVKWCTGAQQLADVMTKKVSSGDPLRKCLEEGKI